MIFLIRHGERIDKVDPNWIKKSKNKEDPPLTKLGKKQSKKTGQNILNNKDHKKFIIISNPYLRCIQTAIEILKVFNKYNNTNKKLRIHNGLTYINKNEELPIFNIKRNKYIGNYLSRDFGYDEIKRYLSLLNQLKNKYKNYDIILITHGEIIEKLIQLNSTKNKKIEINYADFIKLSINKNKLEIFF